MNYKTPLHLNYRYVVVAKDDHGGNVTLLETDYTEEGLAECEKLKHNLFTVMGLNATVCWRKHEDEV